MGREASGSRSGRAKGGAALVAVAVLVGGLAACGTTVASGVDVATTGGSSTTSVSPPSPTTRPTVTPPATTPSPTKAPPTTSAPAHDPAAAPAGTTLRPGDRGPRVAALQQRLTALGYWNGDADGSYGAATAQAVMAFQKSAGLARDGLAGPATQAGLDGAGRPTVGPGAADRVEIDLGRQLLYVVRGGQVRWVLNTSTGSGETYRSPAGHDAVARTPVGSFVVGRTFDGPEVAPLGTLYRPRYFNGGIAVHGAPHVPGYAASHGCARVSNAAMDLIWREGLMPVGSPVAVRP
jgi:peptidoglycan hydrolase-like protein with peptidoglycan-binding domain